MRVIIAGTIGPLGNCRISWIQFLEYDSETDPCKKYGLVMRERLTKLSLEYISTKKPL